VQNNAYSVPTSLIGRQVTVRLYEWHVEVYFGQKQIESMPRLVGQKKHLINYRHLIGTLLRKPGGFRNYRYREALFPSLVFRQAWDQLGQWYAPRKTDLIYLRLLRLATRHLECEVATALTLLLAGSTRWDDTDVEQLLQPQPSVTIPLLAPPAVDLQQYDLLLQEAAYVPG